MSWIGHNYRVCQIKRRRSRPRSPLVCIDKGSSRKDEGQDEGHELLSRWKRRRSRKEIEIKSFSVLETELNSKIEVELRSGLAGQSLQEIEIDGIEYIPKGSEVELLNVYCRGKHRLRRSFSGHMTQLKPDQAERQIQTDTAVRFRLVFRHGTRHKQAWFGLFFGSLATTEPELHCALVDFACVPVNPF